LTCNEIQHLVAVSVADPGHRLRWSWWRRRHQARARTCHYRRQAAQGHDRPAFSGDSWRRGRLKAMICSIMTVRSGCQVMMPR